MIGILTLVWVYYYKTFVLNKSRARISILAGRDTESTILGSGLNQSTTSASNSHNSVPWMEFLNKPSFWSLIIAHVCQNNAYYILLTWLPTYFQENYPGSKV